MKSKGKPAGSRDPEQSSAEEKILRILRKRLRGPESDNELIQATGADEESLEEILTSHSLQAKMKTMVAAYCSERTASFMRALYEQAEAGETWACKVLMEATGLGAMIHAVLTPDPEGEMESLLPNALERDLLENVRDLFRGEQKPADLPLEPPQNE